MTKSCSDDFVRTCFNGANNRVLRRSVPGGRERWVQRMEIVKIVLATACGVLLLALGVIAIMLYTPLGIALRQNPGSFDRENFEAVVAQVRAMSPAAEGDSAGVTGLIHATEGDFQFRLDDLSDPTSLRLLKPNESFDRGFGAGNVWADITPDGRLKVVIETKDLGHAGEYGFAYSDVPLSPQPFGKGWFTIDVPGHINLVLPDMKIDDNWWKVLYNLD